ncbi:MAG: zinc ribbon domain-containing protein [Candidatus Aureabacteria bacterium]|nr:zinc ribbon domain-containing protein [Candidatus Auribacterota bacterium]
MPVFEYRCKQCGAILEVLTRLIHKQKFYCEQCQSSNLEIMLSIPFVFSGTSSLSASVPSCCPGYETAGESTPPTCMR